MNPLPEEKLLKLIRGKGRAPSGAAAAPTGGSASVMKFTLPGARPRSRYGTRLLIGGLSALLLMEFIFLIFQALRPPPTVSVPLLPDTPSDPSSGTEAPAPPMPSLAQSAFHPLFAPPADAPGSPGSVSRPVPSGSATLLASRLTLLGIIAGTPGQAIIEDSQTKKTYFVSPGQVVVEGAMVEEVLDTRVILDLQGEKIELTL